MEPIFKLYKTTLQEKSHRFNFTCLDCSELIIALGTDIGSCHLYSTSTLRPFGQIIYVPNLPHANQTEKKKQQILTSVKFSSIQHEKNFLLLVIGTESGHIHLYNIDIINSTSIKVQTIKIDNNQNSNEEITSLLWCKLEKLSSNYHNTLHNVRGSKLDALQNDNINEAAQVAAIESLKIIVSVNSHGLKNKGGKIYLLHLMSNYLSTTRNDIPVKVVNVQLIYSLPQDLIIQTSFKTHFVLISCLAKCFVLDFSTIYNMSILQEHKKKFKNNIHKHHSLPFVNGANMESMKYFINIYQIGSKPRNGYYGACFDCQSIDGCDQILSARKSGRVWVAETQSGSVRNTLRFKLPKIPNIFADSTTDINQANHHDIVWQKEMKEKPENEEVDEKQNSNNVAQELEPEFANVSTTVCQQLGVLIPFGNWTLSYLHPKDVNNEKVLNLETLSFSKYKQVSKKEKKRNGYHEKLNTFGLKVLDHNLPKLLQWYPNLGKIVDIAVLESQCCFYVIYKPLLHSTEPANASKVILGKVELCSPNESVKSLINNDKITIAIDYICAYKVRDINILENVKKILLKKTEQDNNELNVTTIHKFDVHFEETKQFYDDHNNNVIIMDESDANLNNLDESKQALQAEEGDGDNKDKFTKYRRASLDYKPSQKTTLTDRRKGNLNTDSTQNMTWQPAKFDVTSAKVLGDTVGSPQVVEAEHANYDGNISAIDLSQDSTLKKDKDSDLFSAKKFLSIGKKMIKEISGDLLGNSPKPSPQPPLPPTTDLAPNELENEQGNANEIEIEDVGEDRNDIITDLDSVQTIHFKQKQNIARARRKSSANQQVFLEAAEDINIDEPLKKRHKDKKKKKKKGKKKKKAEFATIDPAPKMEASQRKKKKKEEKVHAVPLGDTNENICEMNANIMSHTAAPGTGSILALDPDITPHEVIYDDNGMLVDINCKQEVVSGGAGASEQDKQNVNITKIHKLLQETAKCDSMLRRRMRNELEELHEEHGNESNEENVKEAGFAAVGLSNINYRNCRALMKKMSYLLGEYEGQINLLSDLFYKWTNKIGERLSTVLTRMLCVFISVKIDIGRECESGVFEILKKFLLILDFEWVLKLCNTHKLYATLRQLAALQYEQNHACFDRVEMEKAYLMQNYVDLIKLIDRYRSPLLVLQYLPLLCEKGYSHLCYTIAVAYFPHCSPWFIRKYMYRDAMDNQSLNVAADEWNNIFKSYLKYLKLLFSIHVRTRCNGLLVLDLITLTLSLNAPANKVLFAAVDGKEKEDWPVPCGYNVATQYAKDKIALIHSENKYSDGLTKYIISIMNDRSYYIEWSYLEIVFKEYGFWKGLYKVYHHFQDIESLILLCVYLDYAQPILNLLCDLSQNKYWKNLLLALSFVYKNQNQANNRLNLEIVIKYMMRNIGATQTLLCLSDKHIANVLNDNLNNIIYKEIVQQQEEGGKRSKLISSVQTSLSNYLLSQYTLNQHQMSPNSKRNIQKYNQDITPEFKRLIETLSNIKHSSDEWTVMSSVNVRPPTQRAAAPLEKNLTDLFVQFI